MLGPFSAQSNTGRSIEDELAARRDGDCERFSKLIELAKSLGATDTKLVWRGCEAEHDISRQQWQDIQSSYLARGYSAIISLGGRIMGLYEVVRDGLIVDDPYSKVALLDSAKKYAGDHLLPWADVLARRMHWVMVVGSNPLPADP